MSVTSWSLKINPVGLAQEFNRPTHLKDKANIVHVKNPTFYNSPEDGCCLAKKLPILEKPARLEFGLQLPARAWKAQEPTARVMTGIANMGLSHGLPLVNI